MKKMVTVLGIVFLTGLIAYPVSAHSPGWRWGGGHHMMGYGGGGPGHCWDYDRGYGRAQGMMAPRYGSGSQYQEPRKPLEEPDVKTMLDDYVKSTRNPNLRLGEIKDKDSVFEAEIVTKDGSLVDKMAVDKYTGWMRSVY